MPEKICVKCGKDVASLKRTKDAKGNYWCAECASGASKPRKPAVPDEQKLTAALLEEANKFQKNVCQNCRSPLDKSATICVNCGFNPDSGRQLHTKIKQDRSAKSSGFSLFKRKNKS